MKKFFLFVFAWMIAATVFGQDSTNANNPYSARDRKSVKRERMNNMLRMEEEGDLIFNKHSLFGIKLATDGYGIFYEKGRYKTTTRTILYQFELNEKKDPKEHKVSAAGDNGYSFNTVVKGKMNNFYQFKMAYGQQHLIGGKGNKNGVAVTALYTGGVSIGMLKPYLVNTAKSAYSDTIFTSTYPTIIDSGWVEQGAGGFFTGWGGLKIKPGLNAKAAIRFDYGRLNRSITAIEAGVTAEYYFSKIPLVAFVTQRQFFFNAYVAIMFGRRK